MPKYIPKPIIDREEINETVFKKEVDSTFREPLDIVDMIKSTRVIPSNMVMLKKIISIPVKVPPPLTNIDPYMPSQKRIVNGFKNAIKSPDRKDCLRRTVFRYLESIDIVCKVSKFSIPVYMRTKKPNDQRKVFIKGESINCATPKYTMSMYKISVAIAPRPKNHAWKKPSLIPLFNKVAFTGPIGAANETPKKKYVNNEFIKIALR